MAKKGKAIRGTKIEDSYLNLVIEFPLVSIRNEEQLDWVQLRFLQAFFHVFEGKTMLFCH